jgi:hypothetical protein
MVWYLRGRNASAMMILPYILAVIEKSVKHAHNTHTTTREGWFTPKWRLEQTRDRHGTMSKVVDELVALEALLLREDG